ncbi:MAG: Rpn family recombination-promoting nuclease/putative transposase [Blastocatellia bacterium]
MIDHDQLFKQLLRTFFLEFIELFLPAVREYLEPDPIDFLDKEIFTDVTAGERHEADLVVKGRFKGQDSFFLIHVEPESSRRRKRGAFGRRMFHYFARLTEDHDLPVYPIALLSYDKPRNLELDVYRVEFPDKVVLEFHFTVIQLNRMKWRDFLRHDNPVASALMVKMGVAEHERVQVKKECLRMIARLKLDPAKTQLLSGFVDIYLELTAQEERQFQAAIKELPQKEREETMEIVTSWMRQGLQQGLQHERDLVLRLLEQRVGPLSARARARIEKLSREKLEELALAQSAFSRPADLTKWLREYSTATGNHKN